MLARTGYNPAASPLHTTRRRAGSWPSGLCATETLCVTSCACTSSVCCWSSSMRLHLHCVILHDYAQTSDYEHMHVCKAGLESTTQLLLRSHSRAMECLSSLDADPCHLHKAFAAAACAGAAQRLRTLCLARSRCKSTTPKLLDMMSNNPPAQHNTAALQQAGSTSGTKPLLIFVLTDSPTLHPVL